MIDQPHHELQPRWLTIKQAAAYSSLCESSVRRLVSSGKWQAFRPVRGKLLLDRLQIDAAIQAGTSSPRRGRGRTATPANRPYAAP